MKNIRLRTTSKRWMFGKDAVNGWIFTGNRLKGIWENAVCSTAIRKFKKQIEQILDEFGDYQTSLYLYGFSAFLEIILQENFVSDYLSSIVQKLDAMSFDYRELYSVAYTRLEEQAKILTNKSEREPLVNY